MILLLLPSFFLYIFSFFNLLGIKEGFVVNHIFNAIVGIAIFFIMYKIGYHFFHTNASFFFWLFVILLAVTFILGVEVKGSRRWIDLYLFRFQASEFIKIFFILFLATYFANRRKYVNHLQTYLASFLFFIIPTLIIFKQPDLGNALVFSFIFFIMILFSPIPKKYLMFTLVAGIILLPLFWSVLKDYQKSRITSFINPTLSQADTSYNMTQALITVGSGNFSGKGLGRGTQSELFFLPENHTDFAFSSLVEQFGFIGGLCLIIFYTLIFTGLIKKAVVLFNLRDENSYVKFLFVMGFLAFASFQVFVNIGMNLGLLPIAGITLPLISYGGSSLITWMMGMAILTYC